MPVEHDSTTEMTQDKPDDCPENHFECWIHQARLMEGTPVSRENLDGHLRRTSVEREGFLLHRTAPHWSERLAVQRRWTVLLQGRQMLWRAVALVRGEAVLGEDGIPLAHHAVALNFGENGS